jgi:hypothetical protein
MIQPAQDLRLSQRDVVSITYQALDDYGVATLAARAQVNANPPVLYPLKVRGDARRVDATFDLDLAVLKLKVGDVVSITIVATDKFNHTGTSDVRHVLVSPRSIDVSTHLRLAELGQAAQYAAAWAQQIAFAQQEIEHARRSPDDASARVAKAGRSLASAAETANQVRQSLLRALMYSASAGMSDALGVAVDGTSVALDAGARVEEALASRRGGAAVDDATAARAGRAAAGARDVAAQVKQLADGDQAAAVLADRANLKVAPTTAPTDRAAQDRRKQMLDRARQDMNASLAALGINPKDGDVDGLLQRRVDAAQRLISAARPIDFEAAAQRWSAGVRANEFQPPRLDDRLAAASQAQSLRPDAELVAAHDLQVASRAAAVLSEPPPAAAPPSAELTLENLPPAADVEARKKAVAEALEQFPGALAALRAEHEVNRRALAAKTPAEARNVHAENRPIHDRASAARSKMIAWASGPSTPADVVAARTRQAEELALAANAATQTKEFDAAAELDKRLATTLNRPEIADTTAAPRALDRLSLNQEKIADETSAAAADDPAAASSIAGAQRRLAEDVAAAARAEFPAAAPTSPDSADARQRTTESVTRASERLAAVPMQLTNAEQLAGAVAEAAARLSAAQARVAAAAPAARDAADRALTMVRLEAEEARRAFDAATRPLRRLADELTEDLRP